jgi:hypothetical protein
MDKLEFVVPLIELEKVKCSYRGCDERGKYMPCYIHTYCLCDKFIEFYNRLDPEDKRAIENGGIL